jgi:hypothetical protein
MSCCRRHRYERHGIDSGSIERLLIEQVAVSSETVLVGSSLSTTREEGVTRVRREMSLRRRPGIRETQ